MSREEPRSIQIRREVLVRLNRLAGRIELTRAIPIALKVRE